MPAPRTVELRGQRIEVTDAMRAAVVAELPEIEWIDAADLRQHVTDAWAAALAASALPVSRNEALGQLRHAPAAPRDPGRPFPLRHPHGGEDRRRDGRPVSRFPL